MTSNVAPVHVEADLRMDVDGSDVAVTAVGTVLHVVSSDPVALWRSVLHLDLPVRRGIRSRCRAIGVVADRLYGLGLRADFATPTDRPFVELGTHTGSPTLRFLTGSSHVSVLSRSTLARTVATLARPRRR